MDFAFSPEQDALREAAQDFLRRRWAWERVLDVADGDRTFDAAGWQELAGLGWLDVAGPDALGVLELAVLAEESAYALLPLPWFVTAATAAPLLDAELAAGVAAGERAVTMVEGEVEADGPVLSGRVRLVPDLVAVTDVLVGAGDAVWVVDVAGHPDTVVRRSTLDRTRPLGELVLDRTPGRRLEVTAEAREQSRRRGLALAACEAVGVAQRALDLAADHAKTRQQFGRVIGTYQAVSHKVADIYVRLQLARSLAYWAAWAVAENDDAQDMAVAAAKAESAEAAVAACEAAIQVHGGIGFTWEHPLHRYYKRAQWLDAFGGNGREHRRVVAAGILGAGA